jgi:hypothetical protein
MTEHARQHLFALGFFLLLATLTAFATEPEENIFLNVQNPHSSDRIVAVVDDLCGKEVFRGRLEGQGERPVNVCAHRFTGAEVTITNLRTGVERKFRNVLHGAKIQVP